MSESGLTPPSSPGTSDGSTPSIPPAALSIGLVTLSLIAALVSMVTEVSLLSGMGTVWACAGGTVFAFVLGLATKRRVIISAILGILMALTLAQAIYYQVEIEKKRDELSQIFED